MHAMQSLLDDIYREVLPLMGQGKVLKVKKPACLGEIVYEPFQKFNNLE